MIHQMTLMDDDEPDGDLDEESDLQIRPRPHEPQIGTIDAISEAVVRAMGPHHIYEDEAAPWCVLRVDPDDRRVVCRVVAHSLATRKRAWTVRLQAADGSTGWGMSPYEGPSPPTPRIDDWFIALPHDQTEARRWHACSDVPPQITECWGRDPYEHGHIEHQRGHRQLECCERCGLALRGESVDEDDEGSYHPDCYGARLEEQGVRWFEVIRDDIQSLLQHPTSETPPSAWRKIRTSLRRIGRYACVAAGYMGEPIRLQQAVHEQLDALPEIARDWLVTTAGRTMDALRHVYTPSRSVGPAWRCADWFDAAADAYRRWGGEPDVAEAFDEAAHWGRELAYAIELDKKGEI